MPSKGRLFVMEAIKWAPEGFVTWFFEQDQSPGIVSLRENRTYTHEVALALIEEKRQGPGDGKDLLSLLGSPCVSFLKHDPWCNAQSLSQGKLGRTAKFATE